MTDDATFNSTALASTISGSATIHVMDRDLIPWALYDLSGARALHSLETMQNYFRRFRELHEKVLMKSHMTPYSAQTYFNDIFGGGETQQFFVCFHSALKPDARG